MGEWADDAVDRLWFRGFKDLRAPRRKVCNRCGVRDLHWVELPKAAGWRMAHRDGTIHVCKDHFKDLVEQPR